MRRIARLTAVALTFFLADGVLAAKMEIRTVGTEVRPVLRDIRPIIIEAYTIRRLVQRLEGAQAEIRKASDDIKEKKAAVRTALRDLEAEETGQGELKLNVSSDVLFAFDSSTIRPEAAVALAKVALVIRERGTGRVRIEGHTDAKGSDAYNQRLSERRARSVRDWLVRVEGLPKQMFIIHGWGESRPVAPNTRPDGSDNPEGRRLNRRVEIFVTTRK